MARCVVLTFLAMAGRDHFRTTARRSVSLNATLGEDDQLFPARVIDLGLSGARIEIAHPLRLGAAVRLQVTAPHLWDPLVLDAHVMWEEPLDDQEGVRAGLRFTHGSGGKVRALAELLDTSVYE